MRHGEPADLVRAKVRFFQELPNYCFILTPDSKTYVGSMNSDSIFSVKGAGAWHLSAPLTRQKRNKRNIRNNAAGSKGHGYATPPLR